MKYNPISRVSPLSGNDHTQFRRALLRWYDVNCRDLPWRHTHDPYRIWISEIMLQQTRVAVVIERYGRFLRKFPSVRALTRAQENSVLAEWSGLGYYRRARNLHAAAKAIVRDFGGEFPRSASELRWLPGVGRYTAAAVASIAFREPVAVVDGNVERVLWRVHMARMSVERAWSAAQELLEARRPGDFNQAMMELGATICLPAQPRCGDCPVRKFCKARGRDQSRKRKLPQQKREVAYLLSRRGDSVLLVRRPLRQSLMPGMWELPEIQRARNHSRPTFSLKHSITTTNYRVHVIASDLAKTTLARPRSRSQWVRLSVISEVPLTGLAAKILRRAGVI